MREDRRDIHTWYRESTALFHEQFTAAEKAFQDLLRKIGIGEKEEYKITSPEVQNTLVERVTKEGVDSELFRTLDKLVSDYQGAIWHLAVSYQGNKKPEESNRWYDKHDELSSLESALSNLEYEWHMEMKRKRGPEIFPILHLQLDALKMLLEDAGFSPSELQYLETSLSKVWSRIFRKIIQASREGKIVYDKIAPVLVKLARAARHEAQKHYNARAPQLGAEYDNVAEGVDILLFYIQEFKEGREHRLPE